MIEVAPRKEASRAMLWLTPVFAVGLTILAGLALFAALGKDPVETVRVIFVDPLLDPFSRTELLVKGAPLALIAIGLSFGFRAGVWNIGAEGQFVIGALAGGAVALAFYDVAGLWLLPLMALAGAAGG
ncbi:MAG: ABC transporter permease, partial [Pseudomonadota bacterium]